MVLPEKTRESTQETCVRPAYDAELEPLVGPLRELLGTMSLENVQRMRTLVAEGVPGQEPFDYSLGGRVSIDTIEITDPSAGHPIGLEIYRAAEPPATPVPVLYYIHGGGGLWGTAHDGLEAFLDSVADGEIVAVSVDYRLAPEHPAPAGVEDVYAGLAWASQHAAELSADPGRLILAGVSAGGGLAVGAALMARDRGFPAIKTMMLTSPMLDDRLETPSSQMLHDEGTWSTEDGLFAWAALLGTDRGGENVSEYVAPARATDLSGLPRTYIEVGSNEMLRDEILAFSDALSHAGVSVDLHMWGGTFHGFETLAPTARVSQALLATRREFLVRTLHP